MKYNIMLLFLLFSLSIYSDYFVVLTLPKTGTNLGLKLVKLLLNKKIGHGAVASIDVFPSVINVPKLYWGHDWKADPLKKATLSPNKEKVQRLQSVGAKVLLLLRDPRQHILALLRATNRSVDHTNIAYAINNFPRLLADLTKNNCYLQYHDINGCYEQYLRWWQEYPEAYLARFEHLVGIKGGGNEIDQVREIISLGRFLNIKTDQSRGYEVAKRLYGGTPTFREGQIDTWKKYFSEENKVLFKEVAGQLLIKLGYEKNLEW